MGTRTAVHREVVYAGCSIPITPSLFFPHVVYIDKSEQAERFFADEQAILASINRRKHYKRSASSELQS